MRTEEQMRSALQDETRMPDEARRLLQERTRLADGSAASQEVTPAEVIALVACFIFAATLSVKVLPSVVMPVVAMMFAHMGK